MNYSYYRHYLSTRTTRTTGDTEPQRGYKIIATIGATELQQLLNNCSNYKGYQTTVTIYIQLLHVILTYRNYKSTIHRLASNVHVVFYVIKM